MLCYKLTSGQVRASDKTVYEIYNVYDTFQVIPTPLISDNYSTTL